MELNPAVYTLIGTLLGGSITLISTWILNKNQTSREYIKIALELAKKDHDIAMSKGKPGQRILPLESFITYYIEYGKIIQNKNFKVSDLSKLKKISDEIDEFYKNRT